MYFTEYSLIFGYKQISEIFNTRQKPLKVSSGHWKTLKTAIRNM